MNIRRLQQAEILDVFRLLSSNGWAHRLSDVDQFAQLIEASQIANVALIDSQVVGFVRGITDGLTNGYLSMVVVAPSHRSREIGKQLVEYSMGSHPGVTWVLRAGREGAAEFFAKLGFSQSTVAMERNRR